MAERYDRRPGDRLRCKNGSRFSVTLLEEKRPGAWGVEYDGGGQCWTMRDDELEEPARDDLLERLNELDVEIAAASMERAAILRRRRLVEVELVAYPDDDPPVEAIRPEVRP